MTLSEAHAALDEWYAGRHIGNLVFFRNHRDDMRAFIEHTVKVREMTDEQSRAFLDLFMTFDFSRAEVCRNFNGEPDRIKVVRSFQCKSTKA